MATRQRGRSGMWVVGLAVLVTMVRCAAQDSASLQRGAGNEASAAPPPHEEGLQESDIFKRDGDRLYILNRFKGLVISDLSNLDAPSQRGRLPLPAEPREMWLHGGTALILTAQKTPYAYGWWRSNSADVDTWSDYKGSALILADVTDAAHPIMQSKIKLGGDCFDGRLRGTVLYLACTADGESDGVYGNTSHIYSLDISEPAQPRFLGVLDIPKDAAEHHIHVTQDYLFLASTSALWGGGDASVTIIDITDPQGSIRARGQLSVPGGILDRFSMDVMDNVLRVASGSIRGNGDVHITTFDLSNPDAPAQLGQATLRVEEELKSARFDGPHGYLVSFRNVDPLFVFDLSDPANPRMTGELEMTGWLDFMVPMGDRVIAMGHEVIEEPQQSIWGRWTLRRQTLAVSLIDVSGTPRLITRVPLDGAWGTIPAERDDYNKLFRVFPEQGLVVFPYRTFTEWGSTSSAGMLLLDWENDTLTLRSDLKEIGLVERGLLWDDRTLVTLSVQMLQVFDVGDGEVQARGSLHLARQVSDFVTLPNGTLVELSGDLGAGNASLVARVAGLDGDVELSRVDLDVPAGFIHAHGNVVSVVGVHKPVAYYGYFEQEKDITVENTTVTLVDFSNPAVPVIRSQLDLGEELVFWPGWGWYSDGQTSPVVKPRDGVLVLQTPGMYQYTGGCSDQSTPPRLTVVDVRDVDAPRKGKRVDFGSGYGTMRMEAAADRVFVGSYSGMYVLDVTDVDAPGLSNDVADAANILAMDAERGRVVGIRTRYGRLGRYEGEELVLWSWDGKALKERARTNHGTEFYAYSGEMEDDLLVLTSYNGMRIYDVRDDRIQELGSLPFDAENAYGGQVADVQAGCVSVLHGGRLGIYMRDDDALPLMRASVPFTGQGGTLLVKDGVAHVAAGYHGLIRVPLQ